MGHLLAVGFDGLPHRRTNVIQFEPGLNVMWGMNGSGKTTLLKILHSALTTDTAPLLRLALDFAWIEYMDDSGSTLRRHLERRGRSSNHIRTDEEDDLDVFRDIEIARLNILEASQSLSWVHDGSSRAVRYDGMLSHRYLPVSRIFDFRNRMGRRTGRGAIGEVLDEVEYDRVFAEQIQSLWSDYHASALSQARFAQQNAINQILGVVLSGDEELHDWDVEQVPASDARRLVTDFIRSNRALSRHLNAKRIMSEYEHNPLVNRAVRTISAVQKRIEEDLAPEKRFAEVLNDLFVGKRVEIAGSRKLTVYVRGDEEIPIANLSSGEKQLMRILLETLVAGSSPVLLDEPEISLHVDWQSRLLGAMAYINPSAQFIVATHSPEILGNGHGGRVIEV